MQHENNEKLTELQVEMLATQWRHRCGRKGIHESSSVCKGSLVFEKKMLTVAQAQAKKFTKLRKIIFILYNDNI